MSILGRKILYLGMERMDAYQHQAKGAADWGVYTVYFILVGLFLFTSMSLEVLNAIFK